MTNDNDSLWDDNDDRKSSFLIDVDNEFVDASQKYDKLHSFHEAAAVIKEEYDEFWDEVKKKLPLEGKLYKELKQIAAMCLRTIMDLKLESDPDLGK